MFPFFSGFNTGIFDEFRRLEEDLTELLDQSTRAWPSEIRAVGRGAFPALNVGATPETVSVYLFAPGLDPKSIGLTLQQNLLTVEGKRSLKVDEKAEYYRQERFEGEFRRVITLPEDVDPERVDAKYREGVLQVSIQRREASRPRQIAVQ